MLFNSYEFLFVFLPAAFILFWYGGKSLRWRLGLLTFASYAFYSWWQFSSWGDFCSSFQIHSWHSLCGSAWRWRFTIVMLASSTVDYWAAKWLTRIAPAKTTFRALLLGLSLFVNLSLLGFFKYSGFFSQIASDVSRFLGGAPFPVLTVVLPVGISFYTFRIDELCHRYLPACCQAVKQLP